MLFQNIFESVVESTILQDVGTYMGRAYEITTPLGGRKLCRFGIMRLPRP
jgi:hypothetical protein